MKEFRPLSVGILACLLTVGTLAGSMVNNQLKRTNANGATVQHVLTIVDGDYVQGVGATPVETKSKSKIDLTAETLIGDNMNVQHFANKSPIGSISGFKIVGEPGNKTAGEFTLSYGYEADEEGNPIYVKEGMKLNGKNEPSFDQTTNTCSFSFDGHSIVKPNYIKLARIGWRLYKEFKIFYGDASISGAAGCEHLPLPKEFTFKDQVVFKDGSTPINLFINTKGGEPEKHVASYTALINAPKVGAEFKVVNEKGKPFGLPSITSGGWKPLVGILEQTADGYVKVLKDNVKGVRVLLNRSSKGQGWLNFALIK